MNEATMVQESTLTKHIRKEILVNIVINFVLNGVIAWFLFKGQSSLTMWGEHGFGPDLITTAVILSWILGAIFIMTHRKKATKGELPTLDAPWAAMFPKNVILAGLCFAVLAVFTYVPLTLGSLYLFNLTTMDVATFAIFKGVWASVLSSIVVPAAIIAGVSTAPPSQ